MPVVQTKTEPRCKLCRHPARTTIEHWLERRSLREEDERGERITLAYVLDRFRELGVENPTEDNIKAHWGKHCELVADDEAARLGEVEAEIAEQARRLAAEYEGRDDPDSHLELQQRIGHLRLLAELKRGELPKVTVDQSRAAVDSKTKRRHNEKVDQLLELQGVALTRAIGLAGPPIAGELVEGDDDDVEEVEA